MKAILDQMEEHIAEIRNLQRKFDFHSKILEKLMISLNNCHYENDRDSDVGASESCEAVKREELKQPKQLNELK